jgi:signal transduction histidine kinase
VKSSVFSFSHSSQQEELEVSYIRWVSALGMIIYPFWHFPFIWLDPNSNDSFWERLAVTSFCAVFLIGGTTSRRLRPHLSLIFDASLWIITAHYFSIVVRNHLKIPYMVGTVIAIFLVTPLFGSRKALFAYSVFVFALMTGCIWWVPNPDPASPVSLFLPAEISVIALGYLAVQFRLTINESLRQSQRALLSQKAELLRSDYFLREQRQILERIARGSPFLEILTSLAKLIENQDEETHCTITLLNEEKSRLYLTAAPSLPAEMVADFRVGIEVGPAATSCGTAVFRREPVISSDISTDPIWEGYRELMIGKFGIHSAWSIPIFGKEGVIYGTVSLCNNQPRVPEARHIELLEVAAHLSGIAIERKRSEDLIIQQQVRLMHSSKMAALGEMAGGLAHEINSPLMIISTGVRGLRRLLQTPQMDNDVTESTLQTVEATTFRIAKIVKGLRTFARDGSKDPFQRERVKTIVNDTLDFCQERFRHHGIKLKVDPIPENLTLDCRAVQLSEVLLNLLNNAHDAVKELAVRWVSLEVTEEGDLIKISVTDSGGGIPAEIQDKLMQPFFSTKAVGAGTGLGLSVSTSIVEEHRGQLKLDTDSVNTRFDVKMPRFQEPSGDVAAVS